ncbi:Transposon Ty1-DR1 Gag-Pol polyprotein [Symbiodinium microadriaticum]|uniref:Transposon Ty1-DR1 Gag-Pol polyprotein n=1 Tax=Symbiodinium microadriaticum TaxID=2951 RepID=A0A1Q9EXK2_SYMMI|nr:Transposon Ty1-DR1 Gag-Pol polyprotein [Symbiodinium microadriaticum]
MAASMAEGTGAHERPVPDDPWDQGDPWSSEGQVQANANNSSPEVPPSSWSVLSQGVGPVPNGLPVSYGPMRAGCASQQVAPGVWPQDLGCGNGAAAPALPPSAPFWNAPMGPYSGCSRGSRAPFVFGIFFVGFFGAPAPGGDPGAPGGQDPDGNGPPSERRSPAAGATAPSVSPSSSAGTSELRSLLRRRAREGTRPKSSIGSVKIEEFYGDRKKYRSWKRAIEAQTQLYQLEAQEVTMLVYLSTKGDARDVLDQLALSEYTCPGGDVVLWKLLDESYDETSCEQFERAERELQSYRRLPGQSIASYVAGMKRLKAQYVRVDPETVMSAKAWGQRLLNRASLGRRERLDVYYSAGGYDPVQIEAALRYRCATVHEDERRVPSSLPSSRSTTSSARSTAPSSTSSSPTKRSSSTTSRGFGFRKRNSVHVAGAELEDIEEEEDLDKMVIEGEFAEPDPDTEVPEEELDYEDEGHPLDEEDAFEEGTVDGETALEAFAAGWKAKGKQAAQRKARGWSKPGPSSTSSPSRSLADKKRSSTCASCGKTGHWRGDPCCPNVLSGRDPPHQPAAQRKPDTNRDVNFVNFTFVAGSPGPPAPQSKREWQVVGGEGEDELYIQTPGAQASEAPPRPMHDVRVSRGAIGKTHDKDTKVKLTPLEALAAVDNMTKEEKKHLRKWLQEEEDGGARQLPVAPDRRGYQDQGRGSDDVFGHPPAAAVPWPERDASLRVPAPPAPPALRLPPRKDERGRDKAKPVLQREMEEFRQALWERSWDGRRTCPSAASPVASVAQARCPHRFEDLVFSGNQHAHWARCKRCDLKHVLYFSERHGVMASTVVPSSPTQASPVFAAFGGTVGQVILDSGCRTAVAGTLWHEALQQHLRSKGILWETVEEDESFQFGAGAPEKSTCACLYPAGIFGQVDVIRMSCVAGAARECPGLVGPSELARWKVCFDFAGRSLSILGMTRDMVLSQTRHPALSIVDFPPGSDPWKAEGVKERAAVLRSDPHSFAFAAAPACDEAPSHENLLSGDRLPNEFFGDFGAEARRRRDQQWLDMLENDLGVKVIRELPDAEATGSEPNETDQEGAETASITSHEFGVLAASDEDTDDLSEEELVADVGGKPCFFHKTMRKKLRAAQGAIKKEFAGAGPRLSTTLPGPTEEPRHVRRPGPWRILEVFSVTMVVSLVAAARGWEAGEPLAAPNWNLYAPACQKEALEYYRRFDPDFLVVSWPSSVWTPGWSGGFGKDGPEQKGDMLWKERGLLAWVQDLVFLHRGRGGAILGENPMASRSWQEPLVVDTWAGLPRGHVDMCAFGLQRPAEEWGSQRPLYLRMPTQVAGQKEIVEKVARLCPRDHKHAPCLGGVCKDGHWRCVGDVPGCYPEAFAKSALDGAQQFLLNSGRRRRGDVFVSNPTFAEEQLVEDDQELLHDAPLAAAPRPEADEEQYSPSFDPEIDGNLTPPDPDYQPVPETTEGMNDELAGPPAKLAKEGKLERIDIVHRRLGHPPNETLVRMLQLGGASEEMIELARHFDCPVCRLGSQPRRPFAAKADSRAVSFGLSVHLDLKFQQDYKGEVYVCLSMVDEATTYHAARLLRNRSPEHVARKFINGWVGLYGVPQRVTLDQGGEFEAAFTGMLESHAIYSKVAGSHSPWQNGYAERHGALLGTAWAAIIAEHQSCGRVEMKTALACAIQGKNSVVSRAGHSAQLLAFGRQACFPDLLEEDVWSSASLGHALSIDSEVARMAEMRSAAKVALLRGDIREKIKRALRRAPAGERRAFAPGELVFFWSPRIGKGRYRRDVGCWRGPAVVILPEGHERYYVSWRGRCLLLSTANLKGAGYDTPADQDLRRKEVEAELEKGFLDLTDEPEPPDDQEATVVPQAAGLQPRRVPNGLGRKMTEARRMMQGLKSVKKTLGIPFDKVRKRRLLGARGPRRKSRAAPAEQPHPDDTGLHEQPPPDGPVLEPSAAEQPPRDDAGLHEQPPPDGPFDSVLPDSLQDVWDQAPVAQGEGRGGLAESYDYLDDVPFSLKRKLAEAQQEQLQSQSEVSTKRLRTEDVANFIMVALAEPELKKLENPEVSHDDALANEWLPRGQVRKLAELLDMPLTAARLHRAPRKRLQNPGPRWRRHRVTVMIGEDPKQVMIAEEDPAQVSKRPRHKCPHLWRGVTFFHDANLAHLRKGELKARERAASQAASGQKVFVASSSQVFQVTVASEEVIRAASEDLAENVMKTQAFILKMKANGKELDPKFFDGAEQKAFDKADQKEWQAWLDNKVIEQLDPVTASRVPRARVFRVPARVVRTNKATAGSKDLVAKSRIVLPGHVDPDVLGGELRTDSPTTTMTAVRMAMSVALQRRWRCLLFDVSTAFLSGKSVARDLYCRPPRDLHGVGAFGLWRILKSAYGLAEAPRLWYMQAKDLLLACGFTEVPFAPATFVKVKKRRGKQTTVAILCLHVDDGFLAVEDGEEAKETQKAIDERFSIKEWIVIGEKPVAYLGMKISLQGDTFLNGKAKLKVRRLAGQPELVTYFDAALGSSNSLAAQRGEAHFLVEPSVLTSQGKGNLLEFHSNKISRVVRSSMAAECCSMSSSADRLVYNMKLWDALYDGAVTTSSTWRQEIRARGHLVTDARSLYDHVHGSNQLAAERQTSLDILGIRQMVQEGMVSLHWVPTWRQYGDCLTKPMEDLLYVRFKNDGCLNVKQSPADAKEEERRFFLRKAQRERRKLRMHATRDKSTLFCFDVKMTACEHVL